MKISVSVKLIILLLLVILALPLAVSISTSVLSKLQDDAKAVNTIGYIRGSSQRLIHDIPTTKREHIINVVNNKFHDIDNRYLLENASYIKLSDFQTNYATLKRCWEDLTKSVIKSTSSKTALLYMSHQCWDSADKTANIAEMISRIKYDESAVVFLVIGCFILLLLILTIFVIHTEVKNKLEISVIQDPLTELYNRSYLYTQLESKIKTFKRTKEPFSLLFIDIDHFKSVNDNFGHSTGDKVLKNFASMVTEILREDDMAFRFGGEEFVVLAMHANSSQALFLAERIRVAIETYHFSNHFSITISIGICEFEDGYTLDKIIIIADSMMYQAKTQGRNQSCTYEAS